VGYACSSVATTPSVSAGTAAAQDEAAVSENACVSRSPNFCVGLYGAIYDFSIEREWLMRAVARAVWGIDMSVLYASMEAIGRVKDGATILDAPCGGGVALRALRGDQDVRYIAADISKQMLARAQRRAERRSLNHVEFVLADLCALPFADEQADLFLSYSGLHMLEDPERAVREIGRCLKPGGELVGTALLAEGSRRQRTLCGIGAVAAIRYHRTGATSAVGSRLSASLNRQSSRNAASLSSADARCRLTTEPTGARFRSEEVGAECRSCLIYGASLRTHQTPARDECGARSATTARCLLGCPNSKTSGVMQR
jgi:SAM-dependent methyltransferase